MNTRGLWVCRMKIFLMKINVSACTLENSLHIFSSVSGKLPPGKFPPIKFPPGKFPPGIFPTMFLNIPARVFKYFFFSLFLPLLLILLKRLFCNSMFQKCLSLYTFVKICQNEVLSEERQLMKWVIIIQVRIFWVPIFRGELFEGGVWWVGIFRVGIPPGEGIFIEPFSSYNLSILIFQKIFNKYNKTFNKKIYFKLIKCCAKFLYRNILFQWARNIFNSKNVNQRKFWVVNKWELEK